MQAATLCSDGTVGAVKKELDVTVSLPMSVSLLKQLMQLLPFLRMLVAAHQTENNAM